VFANIYEFTDGTVISCRAGRAIAGFGGQAPPQIVPAYLTSTSSSSAKGSITASTCVLARRLLRPRLSRERREQSVLSRANTPQWFDSFTCIHPNTVGHHAHGETCSTRRS